VSHNAWITTYLAHRTTLQQFADDTVVELSSELAQRGIKVQFVTNRVKEVASLERKLARPDKTYGRLWDVTDLVGVRIATYFEDSVEQIARFVENSYSVDFRHSTDKSRAIDVSSFGYRSLHYICSAPTAAALPTGFRFEIQLRTVLQHAWAEVEHDLGYRANTVPAQIRRRFSRIASLLEIADLEFDAIRKELTNYQTIVQQQIVNLNDSIVLDDVSLTAMIDTFEVASLDESVAQVMQVPRSETPWFPPYLVVLLSYAGVTTTAELRQAITLWGPSLPSMIDPYFRFSERMLGLRRDEVTVIDAGYSLLFLAYATILRGPELKLNRHARLTRAYQHLDNFDDRRAHELASELMQAVSEPAVV
jgi:putative GTP pyrophosphokinase